MLIFTVKHEKTFGEIVEILDWCFDNCRGSFCISPFIMFNPLSTIYFYFLRWNWNNIKKRQWMLEDELFIQGFPSYFIFSSKQDAALFKLSYDDNDIDFLCETML